MRVGILFTSVFVENGIVDGAFGTDPFTASQHHDALKRFAASKRKPSPPDAFVQWANAVIEDMPKFMKVAIGYNIQNGPWGGGNLFVVNLSKYLIKQGHKVVYDLSHKDIDLIASGSGEKHGIVQIEGNSGVFVRGKAVHVDGKSLTKIFSDHTVEILGNSVLNMYGKSVEVLDSTAGFRGSTGYIPTPWTPREFTQAIANLRRLFS